MKSLRFAIDKAYIMEVTDNHLDDTARAALVARFRKEQPHIKLPDDMTEAFVTIINDDYDGYFINEEVSQ